MARPTKFNPERGETICKRLRAGSTRKAAAESANVSYDCFMDWLNAGQKAKSGEFFQFFLAVSTAEAEFEVQCAAMISKAAFGYKSTTERKGSRTMVKMKKTHHPDGTIVEEPVVVTLAVDETTITDSFDWRAALEMLKRRNREEWGDVSKQEISGPNGDPIEVTSSAMDKAAKELEAWRNKMTEQLSSMPSQPPS